MGRAEEQSGQGSLGGDLRRGQLLAQAEVSQQCGGARDADPLGISHWGLAGVRREPSIDVKKNLCNKGSCTYYVIKCLSKMCDIDLVAEESMCVASVAFHGQSGIFQ